MKKVLLMLFVVGNLFILTNAHASTTYTNPKEVTMTLTEKRSIEKLFGNEYLNEMTQAEFDKYQIYFQNPESIITDVIEVPGHISLYASENNAKKLSINKTSTSGSTLVTINLQWLQIPYIKSYDVMGARFEGVSLSGNVNTFISNNFASIASTNIKNNGFGVSLKLNSGASTGSIIQSFEVTGSGTVYASYNHAIQNISLLDSQSFTISANGLGRVFQFQKNYLFDSMNGVSVAI